MGGQSAGPALSDKTTEKRLDSWKEIATYLNRDVTTVQRWEKREGMPVHRHLHNSRGSVYALSSELDTWVEGRRQSLNREDEGVDSTAIGKPPDRVWSGRKTVLWLLVATAGVALCVLGWLSYRAHVSQPQIHSLAVLPMRNLSGDPRQDYLADGMTEALIGRLAEFHNLRVTSYTSARRFRDSKLSVPEIAKTLGVDAVVEGSVQREGDRIRVTAQLIRGTTDAHFWSETYDREMKDALTLESDLAQAIAEKVKVTITGQEQERLTAARSVAPEVYESYLKGRYALDGTNYRAGIDESLGYFNDAIAKDPTFAPAYLGLAVVYERMGLVATGGVPQETRPKVMAAVRKALELDPNMAAAHVVLAATLDSEWHWTEAESEYKRALELGPNDADTHAGYAFWLMCQGRTDEAVNWVRRARELDPFSVSGADVAWILFQSHRFDEAVLEADDALAVRPGDPGVMGTLGFALLGNGRPGDAIPVLEKAVELSKGSPAAEGILVRAYAQAGRRDDALRMLEEMKRRKAAGYFPAAAFVNAYLGLGDNEQAFVWLEEAYKEKSNILQFVKTHPFFDPIRSDPRFVDLVRRVGLG